MKFNILMISTLLICTFPAFPQDNRVKTLDFIVLLDKSLSMDDKIDGVKDFFRREILGNQLKTGDSLVLIAFYGRQEILVDLKISGPADRATVERHLSALKADGPYTDIGSAIDRTVDYVKTHPRRGDRQHFILLTDGIQESPPGSPYQGPKGYISHPFLDNAKTLARSGWKIQILGIGSDTAAEDLARELSGTASTWDNVQSLLKEENPGFFESLTLVNPGELTVSNGIPQLKIQIEANNMTGSKAIQIAGLSFLAKDLEESIPLPPDFFLLVPGDGVHTFLILLEPEQVQRLGGRTGELVFEFSGSTSFSPGRSPLTFPLQEIAGESQGFLPGFLPGFLADPLVFSIICFIIVVIVGIFVWRSRRPSEKEDAIVSKKP